MEKEKKKEPEFVVGQMPKDLKEVIILEGTDKPITIEGGIALCLNELTKQRKTLKKILKKLA